MGEVGVLKVQQGVWIDEEWIREAGLGDRLRIVVQGGEIRILPAAGEGEEREPSARGWEIWQALGRDAQPGRLPDAAAKHDQYLYGSRR